MNFENYLLRLVNTNDVQVYFDLIDNNRKRLEDFFAGTVSKNKSMEETRLFIAEVTEKAEKKTYFPFIIIDSSTQQMIGYVDIKNIDWNIAKAELGYFIDKSHEGEGIITKALSKMIEYCFDVLQLRKLFLRTHEANMASRKVAEKNGFRVEGIIRSDYKTTSGIIVDLMYYGLLNKKDIS